MASAAPSKERWQLRVHYTRSGGWHRWRLFSYELQVAQGIEKYDRAARTMANKAKEAYKQASRKLAHWKSPEETLR